MLRFLTRNTVTRHVTIGTTMADGLDPDIVSDLLDDALAHRVRVDVVRDDPNAFEADLTGREPLVNEVLAMAGRRFLDSAPDGSATTVRAL